MAPPLPDVELLAALRDRVELARPRLDTGQGVKMLYSDVASLSNRIWTVGLNPGGGHAEPDQWHREDGAHDYRDGYRSREIAKLRPGGLKLREQLAAMVKWLGVDWTETLSLNLLPFRSAHWDKTPPAVRAEALAFAAGDFWPLLLANRTPRLIVSFGNDAARTLRRLLRHPAPTAYPVGWGTVTADVSEGNAVTLLRLPHLSIFRIFDRRGGVGAEELAKLRADDRLRRALDQPRS